MIQRNHPQFTNNKGFSLIEIIMVLVLLGIMGALSSLGIGSFIGTFSQIKQSNDIVSAGQIAILRIAKELIAVKNLNTVYSNGNRIKFTSQHNDGNYTIEIYQSGDALNFIEKNEPAGATSSNTLVESVDSLSFEYYVWDSDNASNPFQQNDPLWTEDGCSVSIKAIFDNNADTTTFEIVPLVPDSILNDHFKVQFGTDTTTTVTSPSGDNETCSFSTTEPSPLDVCKYAYIYDINRANDTMCFSKITITGNSATNIDPDCSTLPPMSSITGHTVTRIIKVILKMQAYDKSNDPYELSIMVSPRNIE